MGLNHLDWTIVAVYLAGITAFGLRFRRRQRSLRDYFLADRNIPWWAIALSIVAAETSTLTIISIPGLAYDQNFGFLQVVIGYLVGRAIIVVIFIPHYFRGDLFTAYQLIEGRFGQRLRALTAGLFLATRSAAEGVRVFAVAIVVRVALGAALTGLSDAQRDLAAIGIVTVLTLIYTFEGGMAAVIWTDVVQLFIYLCGTAVGFLTILHLVPGGWPTVYSMAGEAGKFRIFDFSPSFFRAYTFWAGLIGGTFLTTASHGTDQLIVQRLLAARSERQSKLALLASGVLVFLQFGFFLLIGAMLFVFYKLHPPAVPFVRTDYIFPVFMTTYLPHGVSGLLLAAILAAAMSNLSAALNALSSTAVIDFYLHFRPEAAESRRLSISRSMTVVWGLLLFLLAVISRRGGKVVEVGLSIASVAYGALLGVFLLAVLSRRAREGGAMVGMACGFVLDVCLWQFTRVPWTWYVVIGACVTFSVGYGVSRLAPSVHEHLQEDKVASSKKQCQYKSQP